MQSEGEDGFPETGQEILENTAQHVDIRHLVKERLTSDL